MRTPICLTLCALLTVAAAFGAADELSLTPREGVVLLTNGELITGKIISAGDRYDVYLPAGEISLKRSEVALVCRTAEECYQYKRADIDLGRSQDHLALAEWCVRNGLYDAAKRELADARRADPMHPKLRLIESRLQLAQNPPSSSPPAGTTQPVAHTPLASTARNLPPGTMEVFTNTIQPLLLNYCSKSGCHARRDDGGFRLERIHPRYPSRTTTQRNLEQVLAAINRENPSASALLQAPIRPHGNMASPIFTDRQHGQYRQLVLWSYAVAGARQPYEKPSLQERTAPLLQAIPGASGPPAAAIDPVTDPEFDAELPIADPNGELPVDLEADTEADPDTVLPPASSADQAFTPEQLRGMGIDPNAGGANLQVGSSRVQRGAKLPPAFTPKDEFDPEIFNRRYFGK